MVISLEVVEPNTQFQLPTEVNLPIFGGGSFDFALSLDTSSSSTSVDQDIVTLIRRITRASHGITNPNPHYALMVEASEVPQPRSVKVAIRILEWKRA